MYGYGYRYSARPNVLAFNPLTDVNGLQSYWDYNNVTVSKATDLGTAGFDLDQATGTKQPIVSVPTFRWTFDGVDDLQEKVVSQPYSSDASGIIFFSGYFDNSTSNFIINSSDTATNNYFLYLRINTTGTVTWYVNNAGITNVLTGTIAIGNGSYYFGYLKSTGFGYELNVNGVVDTFVMSGTIATDDGKFFSYVTLRDNLTIGSLVRTTAASGVLELNKLAYTNDHTIDTTNMMNYMSVPSNHR